MVNINWELMGHKTKNKPDKDQTNKHKPDNQIKIEQTEKSQTKTGNQAINGSK